MTGIDKDWISKQLNKGISAEEAVIKAEKVRRDHIKLQEAVDIYDQIIRDDEKHLESMKVIASRYGHESGGMMEAAGGVLGGVKSMIEGVTASEPFQTIGDDLMLKSNAINYDQVWTEIFRAIGDEQSAAEMEQAALDDQGHHRLMQNLLAKIGMMEARGRKAEDRHAA